MRSKIIHEDLEDIYFRDIPWEELRNTTVIITGAYGMLASYIVYMLIYLNEKKQMNINIIAAVSSEEKFRKRFGKWSDTNYISLYTKSLDEAMEVDADVDYIIHAASFAGPQYYSVCPVDVLKPNVIGNYNCLELAVKKRIKGYLLFSTGDVYGKVSGVESIAENDYGTMDTLDIHSCYSESKRMAETMCYSYYHQYGVPIKILRIWHTYAPTMDIEHDPRVFASFMRNLVYGEDIVMKSDGCGTRSFCYIADAVAAYFTVLLRGKAGEAYNICNTDEFYSMKQLAEMITSIRPELGLKVVVKERGKAENYVENTVASVVPPDNTKLKLLGWKPHFTTEKGFGRVAVSFENKK